MFRCRQPIRFSPSSSISLIEPSLVDDVYVCKEIDQCRSLPSSDNMDLKTLLDAGLPIDEVSTIIRSGSVDLSELAKKYGVEIKNKENE
ncbi:hypothetical protein [Capybara microvirus Cap1_SP_55]|nr:hypothetical protein [Capybara microvirus Cap1_SP_55]